MAVACLATLNGSQHASRGRDGTAVAIAERVVGVIRLRTGAIDRARKHARGIEDQSIGRFHLVEESASVDGEAIQSFRVLDGVGLLDGRGYVGVSILTRDGRVVQ